MELGAKEKFSFEFMDSVTKASVTMKDLLCSWLDLDGHPHKRLDGLPGEDHHGWATRRLQWCLGEEQDRG